MMGYAVYHSKRKTFEQTLCLSTKINNQQKLSTPSSLVLTDLQFGFFPLNLKEFKLAHGYTYTCKLTIDRSPSKPGDGET